MSSRVYRPRKRRESTGRTRAAILAAVRDLLAEGSFHEATVEEIAARAGVARATLYLHFGSRMGLIDAICESFGSNPELAAIKSSAELADPEAALRETLLHSARFYASEEPLHRQLYGLAEIDPAARDFVARQTRDRRRVLTTLVGTLRRSGRLRDGDALALLLVLTSFATFQELRGNAGLSQRALERTLTALAERELLAG
jgi:AcrR family transcriptional regulator